MSKLKTIVIGIDGACWEYLNPLINNGRLSNIKKIMGDGIYGILKSTIPPVSPVAWSSFITGQKPHKHGIMDWFIHEDNNKFRTANTGDRRSVPFWSYLNKGGIKVGVVNIPLTYPAEKIDGFFISGFDSPKDSPYKIYPQKILDEFKGNSKWNIALNAPSWEMARREGLYDDFASLYLKQAEAQTEVFLCLIRKYDVDVFIINYMVCDHFNHYMRDFYYIEKSLEKVDECIGEIKKNYKEANFLIISDHGSCRYEKIFFVSEWLKSIGFIEYKEKKYLQVKFSNFLSFLTVKHKNLRSIWMLTRVLGKSPTIIKRLLLFIAKLYNEKIYFQSKEIIDLEKSKLSFYSPMGKAFYLSNENDSKILADELRKLKNPINNGELIKEILFKKDLLCEDNKNAPDLIASFDPRIRFSANLFSINVSNIFAEITSFKDHYGGHTEEGVYIFNGNCFKNKGFSNELNIYDIPAIILYINGIALPENIDGSIPLDFFRGNFSSDNLPRYQKPMPDQQADEYFPIRTEDEEEIKQKLTNLGYL